MRPFSRIAGPLLLAVVALLPGCSSAEDDDELRVVTSFYPLQFVAERVAGAHATVTSLTGPGQEPHDLELSPQRTADVADADVVVHLRGFQPAVDDAVATEEPGLVVDAAEAVDLRTAGNGETDPHFWLNPTGMVELTLAVQDALAEAAPEHEGDFVDNAADLVAQLSDLEDDFRSGLANCARDTVVVSHDAFGAWEEYGVKLSPLVGLSPDDEPAPSTLADLHDLVDAEGITTVFYEPLEGPAPVESLGADLGLDLAVLDPIEGLSDDTADEDYFSLMRANLDALTQANECS